MVEKILNGFPAASFFAGQRSPSPCCWIISTHAADTAAPAENMLIIQQQRSVSL